MIGGTGRRTGTGTAAAAAMRARRRKAAQREAGRSWKTRHRDEPPSEKTAAFKTAFETDPVRFVEHYMEIWQQIPGGALPRTNGTSSIYAAPGSGCTTPRTGSRSGSDWTSSS